ncbi:MAG: hypothetical protein HYZ48_04070, partial [Chlamydiales bacterium]|nr:hypothetical protein [Chlamydiales bacterium]
MPVPKQVPEDVADSSSPHDLAMLYSLYRDLIGEKTQLLEKISHNIQTTVHKMHADPEKMWQQIDFQSDAIEQIIETLCSDIRSLLPEEEETSPLLTELEWGLKEKYCIEDLVEKWLNTVQEETFTNVAPQELFDRIDNPLIDPNSYQIAGYPEKPLPTTAWWIQLSLKNPSTPVDQGCYQIAQEEDGICCSLHQGPDSWKALAKEGFGFSYGITSYDDHCAMLHYQKGIRSMS